MPHHFYHGRTGRVFNVNPRSLGVSMEKQVRNRKIEKRIHVRIEHVRKSNCRRNFIKRVQENDKVKTEANKNGKRVSTKRTPTMPQEEKLVQYSPEDVVIVNAVPYLEIH